MADTQLPDDGVSLSGLAGRMRKLSVGSDTSESFEIVSSPSSVRSVEGNAGGVSVQLEVLDDSSPREGPPADEPSRPAEPSASSSPSPTPATPLAVSTVEKAQLGKDAPNSFFASPAHHDKQPKVENTPGDEVQSSRPEASSYWAQFPDFKHNPTAAFGSEFGRLAQEEGWGKSKKRRQHQKALIAEAAFHFDDSHKDKLDRWQDLCTEVGIEDVPPTITQCKRALKSVYVNLCDLIDHRRDPGIEVRCFKSYSKFAKYARKGHIFPKKLAKQEGFIKVLLRQI